MRLIEVSTEPLNEREVLRGVISSAPEGGYSLEDVRRGVKVLDRLADDGLVLKLEDAEWQFLCQRIKSTQWRVCDAALLTLADKVLGAPPEA